jgi:hypothetical protein
MISATSEEKVRIIPRGTTGTNDNSKNVLVDNISLLTDDNIKSF